MSTLEEIIKRSEELEKLQRQLEKEEEILRIAKERYLDKVVVIKDRFFDPTDLSFSPNRKVLQSVTYLHITSVEVKSNGSGKGIDIVGDGESICNSSFNRLGVFYETYRSKYLYLNHIYGYITLEQFEYLKKCVIDHNQRTLNLLFNFKYEPATQIPTYTEREKDTNTDYPYIDTIHMPEGIKEQLSPLYTIMNSRYLITPKSILLLEEILRNTQKKLKENIFNISSRNSHIIDAQERLFKPTIDYLENVISKAKEDQKQ